MHRLEPHDLVAAYVEGSFPMDAGRHADGPLRLFHADPRAVLPLPMRVPRSVRRGLAHHPYAFRVSAAFDDAVRRCARWDELPDDEIWISERLAAAYGDLHRLGLADTLEAWHGDRLVAAVTCVVLRRAAFAESMWHDRAASGAGHVALVEGVRHLEARGVELVDVQASSPHLERMGVVEVAEERFLALLRRALR